MWVAAKNFCISFFPVKNDTVQKSKKLRLPKRDQGIWKAASIPPAGGTEGQTRRGGEQRPIPDKSRRMASHFINA